MLCRATVESEFGKLAAWNPFFNGKAALAAKKAEAVATAQDVVNELLEKTRKVGKAARHNHLPRGDCCVLGGTVLVCSLQLHAPGSCV